MKAFLMNLLADPVDHSSLQFDAGKEVLINAKGTAYAVENEVPVLLPLVNTMAVENASFHQQTNSHFNYAEHYQQDSFLFDYFKEDESAVGRFERNISRKMIISKVPDSTGIILDVGCGGGWVAQHFLPEGKKVISMDISTTNPARVLKENPGENHAALTADAFFLPLKKNSVDCIIASEVIEHVNQPGKMIEGFLDVLKPGGRILLLTPYNEKIKYHLCVHCNKPTPESAHLHSFNEQNIAGFLPPAGIRFNTTRFVNKYFLKLRIYNILSFLPLGVWKLLDRFANKIKNQPRVFLVEINKLP
jgi:2-polyprenyl-3-methyl-5-hydroxy-6-metoxy-1,4-benzoquinol methylase